MQKLSTCLWFDGEAEEAVKFYTSIFKDSEVLKTTYFGDAGHETHGRKAGSVMTIDFKLEGRLFTALNGGPHFKFNEAVSLVINCETQDEIDYYWEKLSAYSQAEQCGWLKDKYGLSWQVVPEITNELFDPPGSEASERTMDAMLKMKKLDIEKLKKAYRGDQD